jgi:hypothetical protein
MVDWLLKSSAMADNPQPLAIRRRSILQMLTGTAIAGAIPAIANSHPIIRHLTDDGLIDRAQAKAKATTPRYKPEFLDQHQFETLQSLAERTIPGAAKAKTSEFIDQLLAVEANDEQREFLSALGAFEGQAIGRAGRPWKSLPEPEQIAILTEASTMSPGSPRAKPWTTGQPVEAPSSGDPAPTTLRDHFDLLKGWIAGAYYSSEIGMTELGWTGNMFYESFPGCDHPDGHA